MNEFDGGKQLPDAEIPHKSGHAVIVKYLLTGDLTNPYETSQSWLTNGEALIFLDDESVISCDIKGIIPEIERSFEEQIGLELIALIGEESGTLSITNGSSEQYWEIGEDSPEENRVFGLMVDDAIKYACFWGATRAEVKGKMVNFHLEVQMGHIEKFHKLN